MLEKKIKIILTPILVFVNGKCYLFFLSTKNKNITKMTFFKSIPTVFMRTKLFYGFRFYEKNLSENKMRNKKINLPERDAIESDIIN